MAEMKKQLEASNNQFEHQLRKNGELRVKMASLEEDMAAIRKQIGDKEWFKLIGRKEE